MTDSFGYLRIVKSHMMCFSGMFPLYRFSKLTQQFRTLLRHSAPKRYLISFILVFLNEPGKGERWPGASTIGFVRLSPPTLIVLSATALQWALEEYVRTEGKTPNRYMKPSLQLPFSQANVIHKFKLFHLLCALYRQLKHYTSDIWSAGMACVESIMTE